MDKFKLVLKNLNDLLLGEPNKREREFEYLERNLTLYIFFFSTSLDPEPLALIFITRCRWGNYSNSGMQLPLKVFLLELGPYFYDVFLYLSLLEVNLCLQQSLLKYLHIVIPCKRRGHMNYSQKRYCWYWLGWVSFQVISWSYCL